MPRERVEELEGAVRFHHLIKGQLEVLDARGCANRWKVFHSTYSFCLVVRLEDCSVEWIYDRRIYRIDRDHRMMLMQPGEVHANLRKTPPADFIVVQVGDELMQLVARELGWRERSLNIKPPHQASRHPALLAALRRFHQGLCNTLYAPGDGGQCSCGARLDLHLRHLVELVAAFVWHCAEGKRQICQPRSSSAFIAAVTRHLCRNYRVPYHVEQLLREVAPSAYDPSYLLHEFKETHGVSPGEFRNMILATLTRDALAGAPTRPFARIVSDVGWPGRGDEASDRVRAAYRHFKREWGITPGQFARGAERAWELKNVVSSLKLLAGGLAIDTRDAAEIREQTSL